MYSEKINGLGGLPVGTSGKVLCLLSGGIDSVVAAWLMMKRGCGVDFVHFHALKDNKEVKNSKIAGMARSLNRFQFKSKLYIIPYSVYALESDFYKKYDLVAFKHYILKTANRIGNEKKYFGIVTGDNLSQVASQTIENIKATSMDISLPIFRPLLTYDKQEIINLSKKIGTFDLSIEKYKDCCSIVSKNPSTKTNFGKFKRIIEESNMNDLIDNSLKEMEEIEIN